MVQLAPDASPLSHCLQPKKYALISSTCLDWTLLFIIEINPRFLNYHKTANN